MARLGPSTSAKSAVHITRDLSLLAEVIFDEGVKIEFHEDDEDSTSRFNATLSQSACVAMAEACLTFLAGGAIDMSVIHDALLAAKARVA